MTPRLARALYSAALWLATPAYFARLWWRGRHEPGYRAHWAERLGFLPPGPAPAEAPGPLIWLHAVSLGETRAAAALVDQLRRQHPGLRLLLTHGTATGREAGATLLRDGDRQAWLPYDTPAATRRFLRRARPLAGVLMETEIWPNLLQAAQAAQLPVVLANARLSEKSAAQGRRFGLLLRPAAAALGLVLAQTPDDARRLREAGARPVEVSGNLKFDLAPAPALLARGEAWRRALRPRAVVLAASLREGEDLPLLQAWSELEPDGRPLLLLVPRHPQRFDEVAAQVEDFGFSLVRRSRFGDMPPDDALAADVWLGDSLGEMPMYYAAATVALLGGSFAALGGQNLIEAAACGCPVVMGPHTFNFAEAARLSEAAGAAVRVAHLADGVAEAVRQCGDRQREARVQRALQFAGAHRGAAQRMARRILAVAGLEAARESSREPLREA